ncbi:BCCT family transporter [Amphibiibacter pelophylacis]|uniref:BCCT family transporter n=1 Tax=Amphibiibacter pelophylacis TaxID=1799477 RepID=A0ACC6P181_9BURK
MVFRIAVVLVATFVALGVFAPGTLSTGVNAALAFSLDRFGWFYLLTMLGFLAFAGFLAFSRYGNIRLGGEDAEPDYSTLSWFAMLFAAGMGIGLVFYGAAEPVSHYAAPPAGLDAQTTMAAREAMRYTFFHWGLHPWAAYAIVALALAYTQFNLKRPALISSALIPLLGEKRIASGWGQAIDILAIVCTAFGVATSLGLGAAQIATGLKSVWGVDNGSTTQLIIIVVATLAFLVSAMTGVAKGIQWLSNINLALAALVAAILLIVGPTFFILETFTTTLGGYLNNLIAQSLRLTPFSGNSWAKDWTVFYWAWWITWSPFVGLFIANISRGRTLREFVIGVMLVPTLVSFAWFSIFGGTALSQILAGNTGLIAAVQADMSSALFSLFASLPAAGVLSVMAVILLLVFFVTSADSATFVLAQLSSRGVGAPPNSHKLVWGLLIAAVAAVLLMSGGLKALQTMVIVTALPFAVLMIGLCVSLLRSLRADLRATTLREQRRRAKVDELLTR